MITMKMVCMKGLATWARVIASNAAPFSKHQYGRDNLPKGRDGRFNRSVQHGRVFCVGRIGGMGMANPGRPGLSAVRKKELWDRWKAGESISDIARALKKPPGSIHGVLKATGGIAPPHRRRSRWPLTLAEREEISRGLAAGDPLGKIAVRLGRSASTVSREVSRNGGRRNYRALKAEERAWELSRRPKRCLLAANSGLRDLVA